MTSNVRSVSGKRRKQRQRQRMLRRFKSILLVLALCLVIAFLWPLVTAWMGRTSGRVNGADLSTGESGGYEDVVELLGAEVVSGSSVRDLQGLQELLEKNEEALDFVKGYLDREQYKGKEIDLSADFVSGQVPLLIQWDRRWGYDLYGDSMIGLAGCGPTCLAMAYLYFTEDTTANPRTMAEFAYDNGYYAAGGTSWSLWTDGVEKLGLKGEELPLDQNRMERAINEGALIVCSMRPGDFTTTGHFILLYGYDENGFYVNDPNRRSNSEKQWTYDRLQGQIKNLWAISK